MDKEKAKCWLVVEDHFTPSHFNRVFVVSTSVLVAVLFFTMLIRLEYFLDFLVRVFLPSKKESATVECHLTFASSRFGLWAPSSRVAAAWSSSDVSRSERNVVLGSFGIRSFGPSRSFQSCGQTCQRNVDKDNPEFFQFFVVTTAAT